MGDRVDREVAMSQQDKEVETEAVWQSHYIFWCSVIGIPDPCGNKIGYQCIAVIYIKFVMCGINYYNKDVLWLSTLRGYATGVNNLFQLRGYKQPTELSNPSNMPGIIINNLIKEETVASQRSPLDSTIFVELQWATSSSHSHDSDRNLLFDMLTLSHFIEPCVSEYAQTTQDKVDYHVYPSGTRVIKAFTANDFIFYDKSGHILKKKQWLNTQHSHICGDNLAHPKESSKRSQDQAFCRYKEPCNMPCTGSIANGYESQPSWTTRRHAGCLL
jgi:hypothetical protein